LKKWEKVAENRGRDKAKRDKGKETQRKEGHGAEIPSGISAPCPSFLCCVSIIILVGFD